MTEEDNINEALGFVGDIFKDILKDRK